MAEFASVVDAVNSAVEIQEELKARNAGLAESRRMHFRIGINLGDVIQEGERIYGDGVNVAARIESLADPGGICISRSAYDQVKKKLPLGFEHLGEHTVKNIDDPVRVYAQARAEDSFGSNDRTPPDVRRLAYREIYAGGSFTSGRGCFCRKAGFPASRQTFDCSATLPKSERQ
jgi:hypothetical protein